MVATGVPAAIIVGAVTGWTRRTVGLPTWASWTVAVPVAALGAMVAWSSTPFGRDGASDALLKAYRRDGIEAAEKQLLLDRLSPARAGLQWFNVAILLERAGDAEGVEAVCRHAAEKGFPPAMAKLAYLLGQSGEEDEAQSLYRRALDAGFKPTGDA